MCWCALVSKAKPRPRSYPSLFALLALPLCSYLLYLSTCRVDAFGENFKLRQEQDVVRKNSSIGGNRKGSSLRKMSIKRAEEKEKKNKKRDKKARKAAKKAAKKGKKDEAAKGASEDAEGQGLPRRGSRRKHVASMRERLGFAASAAASATKQTATSIASSRPRMKMSSSLRSSKLSAHSSAGSGAGSGRRLEPIDADIGGS